MATASTAGAWSQGGARSERPSAGSRATRAERGTVADRSMTSDREMSRERGMGPDRAPRQPRSAPPRARVAGPDRMRAPEDDMSYRGGPADYPRASGPRRPASPVRGSDRGSADRGRPMDSERIPAGARSRSTEDVEPQGRRMRGAVAVLGVFLVTLAGAGIDSFVGIGLGMITLIALVGATVLATLLVRRSDLVTLVVAPPLVFMAVAAVNIALAPSASFNLATIATLLIRGFPTMAIATVAAIVLALVRWAARR